jgi:glycosyltransferase involved in cell wall biosynthesis
MNISYFIGSIAKGGAEKLLLMLCSEMKSVPEINSQVVVFEKKDSDLYHNFIAKGIKVTYLNSSCTVFKFRDFLKIYKWFINNKPDIVHTHAGAQMDRFILLTAFLAGIKTRICTIHNMDQSRSWRARLSYKLISVLSKKIIAVSDGARSFYCDNSFFNKNKITVIYNCPGFNVKDIQPRSKGIASKKEITLIHVGSLRIQKGQLYLLEALNILNKTDYKFKLDIYGADRFGYGEILFEKVTELGLNNVSFLGETDNIPEKYIEADILIASSIREALHMVILEAISIGIPIVATNIPPHKEILNPISSKFLVEPYSGNALAEAIYCLVQDDKRYIELSKEELKRSFDFTVIETTKKHIKLYNDLC